MKISELIEILKDELDSGDGCTKDEIEFVDDKMEIKRGYVTIIVRNDGSTTEIYND